VCQKYSRTYKRRRTYANVSPRTERTVCSLGHNDGVAFVFGKKLYGAQAAFMKKIVDNRSLYKLGGISLMMKKGKL